MRYLHAVAALMLVGVTLSCDGSRDSVGPESEGDLDATAVETSEDTQEYDLEEDPFEVGATLRRIDELGVPTPELVQDLESNAYALLEAEGCEAALDVLQEFGRQANWLANLIAGGLEPFYRASVSDQRELSVARISSLVEFESMANEFKRKRNGAMIARGECLLQLGEKGEGTAILLNALRLTPVSDQGDWDRARNALYETLEVVEGGDQ